MHTEKFKNQLVIVFFAAVNHDYHDNQQILKKQKKENGATLPVTTHRPDILSPLKFFLWTSVSWEVHLDNWLQQKCNNTEQFLCYCM